MTTTTDQSSKFVERASSLLVGNKKLWVLYFIFLGVSALAVSSASSSDIYSYLNSDSTSLLTHPLFKHLAYILVGIVTTVFFARTNPNKFPLISLAYMIFTLVLIMLLPILGIEVNGATRWINLGPVTFQPSEFFKLALILLGSYCGFLARTDPDQSRRYFWIFWGIGGVFVGLLGLDNLSLMVILFGFMYLYSWVLEAPRRILVQLALIGAVIIGLFVGALLVLPASTLSKVHERSVTWKNRLTRLTTEDANPFEINDANRQEQYGQIALANSQGIGTGPGQSQIKQVLPMAQSDFVLAVIIEEYGVVSLVFVSTLYVFWFLMAGFTARRERNWYRRFLLLGIGILFPMQALVNIAVVSGKFMTGQTLPLISAGGSSMIVCSIAFGLMISISKTQSEIESIEKEAKARGIDLNTPSDILTETTND